MSWAVNYVAAIDTIEVVYAQDVSASDFVDAFTRRVEIQHETGAQRILIDAAGIDSLSASLFELLEFPKTLFDERADRRTQTALVLPATGNVKESGQFFETACRNRGWNVRILANRTAAIDWLTRRRT